MRKQIIVVLMFAASLEASLLESFEGAVNGGDILWPMFMSLAAGMLTTLSPCVYPLIPITLSIMGTRRYDSHVQGLLTALSYVAGMSLVYSIMGAIFASIGLLFGTFMQHPVVLIAIALLFVVMALSMFGVLKVVIPERLLTKLSKVGGQGKQGAFLMGMVAGLLAVPCTGPVLGFILTLIASTSDVVLGIALMLAFSLGMGTPFLVLGTFFSAVTRLPKSGPWMDNVKNIFGAIILGTALYYFSLVWPELLQILQQLRGLGVLTLMVALVGATVLLSFHPQQRAILFWSKQLFGASVAALAVASLLTFDNGTHALDAISQNDNDWFVIDASTKDHKTLDRLLKEAQARQMPVLIDFFAEWCVACKQMEQLTFQNEDVLAQFKQFMLIRVDATKSSDYLNELERQFKVTGLPTIVFIAKSGQVSEQRVLGFLVPEKFLSVLEVVNSD